MVPPPRELAHRHLPSIAPLEFGRHGDPAAPPLLPPLGSHHSHRVKMAAVFFGFAAGTALIVSLLIPLGCTPTAPKNDAAPHTASSAAATNSATSATSATSVAANAAATTADAATASGAPQMFSATPVPHDDALPAADPFAQSGIYPTPPEIAAHVMPHLEACFASVRVTHKKLAGKATLLAHVDATGKVLDVTGLGASEPLGPALTCLVTMLKKAEYPPGEATYSLPVELSQD